MSWTIGVLSRKPDSNMKPPVGEFIDVAFNEGICWTPITMNEYEQFINNKPVYIYTSYAHYKLYRVYLSERSLEKAINDSP